MPHHENSYFDKIYQEICRFFNENLNCKFNRLTPSPYVLTLAYTFTNDLKSLLVRHNGAHPITAAAPVRLECPLKWNYRTSGLLVFHIKF